MAQATTGYWTGDWRNTRLLERTCFDNRLAPRPDNNVKVSRVGILTTRCDADLSVSSIAHVNQIHQLAWQPVNTPTGLASCSEDGTLKILIVQMATD